MSDPRFARLKTDPRFRRPKKHSNKVVVDERFKEVFSTSKSKGGKRQLVDKYGRPLPKNHEQENLRRFYQLEATSVQKPDDEGTSFPDYARGEVVLESSDEEDEDERAVLSEDEDESDAGGVVAIGVNDNDLDPDEAEVDLDESQFADLDAQAAAYAKSNPESKHQSGSQTRRLAAVNLDWDHVRASHLYKICSSILSPTASVLPASTSRGIRTKGVSSSVVNGRVLSVRVYPSEFGKQRLAREEKEGPPPEVFKRRKELEPEQVNEKTIYEVGDGEEYNADALRKYQLERLRYYYAIITCDTIEAAAHIYDELEGTELERSANVFDLSFVPDDMTFDSEPRDEATDEVNLNYKPVEFVTDALRHSKVKLTWDDDDPERNQVTRRAFSQKEIEEADFRAYIASSEDESDAADSAQANKASRKTANRDKLRALLLGGEDNDLPEGWGADAGDDVDMEITFTPGLSHAKDTHEETTLERYQRQLKEKKKQRKNTLKEREMSRGDQRKDAFFNDESDDGNAGISKVKSRRDDGDSITVKGRNVSTAEELSLLAVSDRPDAEPNHFDMKSVLKSEKGKKEKKGKKRMLEAENELQEDFAIDVQDQRFAAVHEDHAFAIDPSNPHFKKTKSMAALLGERSKRRKGNHDGDATGHIKSHQSASVEDPGSSLRALVDRVKRKSVSIPSEGHRDRGRKR